MVTYTTLEGVIAHLQDEALAYRKSQPDEARELVAHALETAVLRLQTPGARSRAMHYYEAAQKRAAEDKELVAAIKKAEKANSVLKAAAVTIRVYTVTEMDRTCRELAEAGYRIVTVYRVDSASHAIVAQLT